MWLDVKLDGNEQKCDLGKSRGLENNLNGRKGLILFEVSPVF